jgi:hypothetical protein
MGVSRSRTNIRLKRTIVAVLSVLALLLGALRYVGVFGGNVREVVRGELYRSAQLTGPDLDRVLHDHHIRSVVNLRGALTSDRAYRAAVAMCRDEHVRHADVSLSAQRLPPPPELAKLIADFDTLPRPILVHCAGGADRSGLAATLYLTLVRHVPLDEAIAAQLTWRYGHLSFGSAHPMDDFFSMYRRDSHGMPLREWIVRRYPTKYAERT